MYLITERNVRESILVPKGSWETVQTAVSVEVELNGVYQQLEGVLLISWFERTKKVRSVVKLQKIITLVDGYPKILIVPLCVGDWTVY